MSPVAALVQTPSESREVAPPSASSIDPALIPAEVRGLLLRFADAGMEAVFTGPLLRELLDGNADSGVRVDVAVGGKLRAIRALVEEDGDWVRWLQPEESRARPPRRQGLRLLVPLASGACRTVTIRPFRDQAPPSRWFREQKLRGLALDLATREITIHAMAGRADGTLVDPYGGVPDWRDRLIRPVIEPNRVFRESGLWLLKMPKYVARYGFATPPEVMRAAKREAGAVLDVPRHTWKPQLDRLLLGDFVMQGLDWLHDTGVLPLLMHEVESMIGFHKTCPHHHKDLWDHTKLVIHQADKNLVVRWAALMHDIGKVWTRSVTRAGKVHFFRHEEMGAILFEGVAARLQFTAEETTEVAYVIRQHSRVNLYDETWTDSAVRRLITECGDRLHNLIAFSKADFTTKRESRREEIMRQLAELERRLEEIRAIDARVPPLPKGLGTAITERFGVPPSKRIGELRDWLEAEVESGRVAAHQEIDHYIDHLAAHSADLGL